MNPSNTRSLSARAAAWYSAAYRRLEASERASALADQLRHFGTALDTGLALVDAAVYGGEYDARAAIASRYARMVSL